MSRVLEMQTTIGVNVEWASTFPARTRSCYRVQKEATRAERPIDLDSENTVSCSPTEHLSFYVFIRVYY